MNNNLSFLNKIQQCLDEAESISYDPSERKNLLLQPLAPHEISLFRRNSDTSRIHSTMMHGYYILWFALAGEGNLLIEKQLFFLKKGDFILLFPGQPHMRLPQNSQDLEYLLVRFRADAHPLLESLRNRRMRLNTEMGHKLNDLIVAFNAARKSGDLYDCNLCTAALTSLLYSLVRSQPRRIAAPIRCGSMSGRIQEVCHRYMTGRTPELSFDELAEKLGISGGGLRRNFKQFMGCTPKKFQKLYRLNTADHLLCNTDLSISEIAKRCGFNSLFSFSRFFSLNKGISPVAHRKKHKNQLQ